MTIDDDVAAALERLRKTREDSLKELVNEALRRGLKEMSGRPKRREPFATRTVSLGRPRLANIDNIAEAIALVEGDSFR